MKPRVHDGFHRPFAGLAERLREHRMPLSPSAQPSGAPFTKTVEEDLPEEELFRRATADIRPLKWNRLPGDDLPLARREVSDPDPEDETAPLRRLVEKGQGFEVRFTSEFIAGPPDGAPEWLIERLHRGAFAVQGHLDLHGFALEQARIRFDGFMREAVREGKQGVLIIHGRGLSSPGEPVLKTELLRWLNTSPWRRWVIAYASARLCDGGAGATAVLLRRNPSRRGRATRPPRYSR